MKVSTVCQDRKHRVFNSVEEYEAWVQEYRANRFNEADTQTTLQAALREA